MKDRPRPEAGFFAAGDIRRFGKHRQGDFLILHGRLIMLATFAYGSFSCGRAMKMASRVFGQEKGSERRGFYRVVAQR